MKRRFWVFITGYDTMIRTDTQQHCGYICESVTDFDPGLSFVRKSRQATWMLQAPPRRRDGP